MKIHLERATLIDRLHYDACNYECESPCQIAGALQTEAAEEISNLRTLLKEYVEAHVAYILRHDGDSDVERMFTIHKTVEAYFKKIGVLINEL